MSAEATRGPGRPPVGPATTIRLPEKLAAWLDRQAAILDTTRAGYIREVLEQQMLEDERLQP